MPLPATVARFNRRLTNPIARQFGGWIAPFAILTHTGRTSGNTYRTPLMAFRAPDGFTIALTYGPRTDWVRNVFAAGGCMIEYRRRQVALTDPRLAGAAEVRTLLPAPVRLILRLIGCEDFLLLKTAEARDPA